MVGGRGCGFRWSFSVLVVFLCLLLLLIILLIGAYSGTTFDCGSLSLSTTVGSVCQVQFLGFSEGVALYLFVLFKGANLFPALQEESKCS